MSPIASLFSILGALLVGAVSPGPSFVLVSRITITTSRLDGLAAALGMAIGGAIMGTFALAGLSILLQQMLWLYLALKIVGGAYLIYLGVRIWRGALQPIRMPETSALGRKSHFRSFWLALATQLSNPKAVVVYGGIVSAFLPPRPPTWLLIVLPPLFFMVEIAWYSVVALAFSASRPRAIYLDLKVWIDRVAGAVMGTLGARLIIEGLTA